MSLRQGLLSTALAIILSVLSVIAATAACSPNTVHLRGDWGQARFTVEVADNAAERSRGLMGRPSMPMSSGMLFVYHQTKPLAFWMRNTLIPLDMIFLDENGVVVRVHHNAVPLDETPIPSGAPARYVLEVNAGLSKALGINAGSELRHPSILQTNAAWRCSEAS
ncbi:DUF192 domain-containing protein [Cognatishimia activa]|uniref:DUF192 domain-containing protein n=1 Tax=Cognatishimia activa TaxID=1715691 RepID=UPI00223155A4|nr:DUF192 domain-containing protein [Cognatishimia activa]UZD92307.1 DUF192 domain-containing protein [Cognatishimia activa]